MRIMCREQSVWRAAGLSFILLGFITLLLLPATARGQSGWGPGVLQASHPKASEVSRQNLAPPDLRLPAPVFFLQTNFRKYLETWPTPGSTATEAWPEYFAEDGEDVD